jgi:phage N-6-adenine-methyltransferase
MDYRIQKVMFSSKRHDHGTPEDIFKQLDREFHFTLDVCADGSNAMVKKFLTQREDGLRTPWTNQICWMNPPYGREIPKWISKALRESRTNNATVVCLVPARTDTNWFWDYCLNGEIRFIKGRLRFKGETSSAPFPSMIVIFRPAEILEMPLHSNSSLEAY